MSSSITVSVTSNSRRSGGRPDERSAAATTSTISRLLNCTGDMFTATLAAPGQAAASAQACCNTHSPRAVISPISSARGMNSLGGT